MIPKELKHCSGQLAEISLVEYPGCPRYEVEAYRLDGGFLIAATDDVVVAEEIYVRASLTM